MTCETTIHQKFSVVIINTSADRSNLPELSQPSPLSVIADSRNPSLRHTKPHKRVKNHDRHATFGTLPCKISVLASNTQDELFAEPFHVDYN